MGTKYRQRRRHLEGVGRDTGFDTGSQAMDMLVKERSWLTRERSTRNYYIGAGRAGVWGLKGVSGSLGCRLGLPGVSHLGSKYILGVGYEVKRIWVTIPCNA